MSTEAGSAAPTIALVVARGENGAIGVGGADAVAVDSECPGLAVQPLQRRVTVVQPRRESVFGCEAVVNRNHDAVGSIAQAAAQGAAYLAQAPGEDEE